MLEMRAGGMRVNVGGVAPWWPQEAAAASALADKHGPDCGLAVGWRWSAEDLFSCGRGRLLRARSRRAGHGGGVYCMVGA